MCEELNTLESAIDLIQNAAEEYKQLPDKLEKKEKEEQDILHILELSESLSAPDLVKLAIELRKVLQERRELKNKKRLYAPFKYFINANEGIIDSLNKTKNNIEKADKNINACTYTPNCRFDLAKEFASEQSRIVSEITDGKLEELKQTLERG